MKTFVEETISQIEENKILYREGDRITSIAVIVKGSIMMNNAVFQKKLGPGNIVGITDLYTERYSNTYITLEECSIYFIEAKSIKDIDKILQIYKDKVGYMTKSLNISMSSLYDSYTERRKTAENVYQGLKTISNKYEEIRSTYTLSGNPGQQLPEWPPYEKPFPIKEEWINLVKESIKVPVDVLNAYFSYIPNTVKKEIDEKIKLVTILHEELKGITMYLKQGYQLLFDEHLENVIRVLGNEIKQLAPSHANYSELTNLVDQAIALLDYMESRHEDLFKKNAEYNRTILEKMYFNMLAANDEDMQELIPQEPVRLEQLADSRIQVFEYSQIPLNTSQRFGLLLRQFKELPDKFDISEETRALRKELTALFFYVYKQTFLKAYETRQYPKAVELFLNFGLIDETLLSEEHLTQLLGMRIKRSVTHYCQYYTIFDWLVQIHEGKKEPSKNEFDQDYRDYVRTLRQEGKISEAEEVSYRENCTMKLDFEINNLFLNNMKLTNGKIRIFVPFLYDEILPKELSSCLVSPNKLDRAIRDIVAVDFSAFYQEVVYSNPRMGMNKEMVMQQFLPDIIVFPNFGEKGIMWQDIENKKRASSARFCLSILHQGSLEETMTQVIGKYRWEMCRTQQGLSWNDVANRCLTSEYSDYIQFYRKNKDLSEDKKDKIKQQLFKARNNTKECFVLDYEAWVRYESQASLRLNKVARSILAMYCPFVKEIRLQLMERSTYGEAFVRYERDINAKSRVLEAKALAMRKKYNTVPTEIEHTISYYKEK